MTIQKMKYNGQKNIQTAEDIKNELKFISNFDHANNLQWFFKTGKGQYGEGDVFIGVKVPNIRKVAKRHTNLPIIEIKKLLYSKIHEERLCALLILVEKYIKSSEIERKKIFNFYIINAKQANNWDLVDLSCSKIIGNYLINKNKKILYKFAISNNLWKRRISIISTYTFIRNMKFKDSFKIAKILMNDKHDLIHKAVGWMLREVGKRNLAEEENFVKKYYKKMPRTMLRYAIEKFEEEKRINYLKGRI